jgi:hypothetical protein
LDAFGKRGGTTTQEVIAALRHFGIPCADKLTRISAKAKKPDFCMVVLRSSEDKSFNHWCVYYEKRYYNPDLGIGRHVNGAHIDPESGECFEYAGEVHETSFLAIYPKD